jgi:hypothetical protein
VRRPDGTEITPYRRERGVCGRAGHVHGLPPLGARRARHREHVRRHPL